MRFALSAAATFIVLTTPILAHADSMVLFEITGSNLIIDDSGDLGNLDLTFTLPKTPTDVEFNSNGSAFRLTDSFDVDRNGVIETAEYGAQFYSSAALGGLTLLVGEAPGFDFGGDQVYSGSVEHPFFLPGTYSLYGAGGTPTLTVSDIGTTVTPEPTSFALLGTGTLGVTGIFRRKRTTKCTAVGTPA